MKQQTGVEHKSATMVTNNDRGHRIKQQNQNRTRYSNKLYPPQKKKKKPRIQLKILKRAFCVNANSIAGNFNPGIKTKL